MANYSRGREMVKLALQQKKVTEHNQNIGNTPLQETNNIKSNGNKILFDPGYIIGSPAVDGTYKSTKINSEKENLNELYELKETDFLETQNPNEDIFYTSESSEYFPSEISSSSSSSSETEYLVDQTSADNVNSQRLSEKEIPTRKRLRDETNWRRNKIKKLKNSGKEYVNWKNNIIPAKSMKPPCPTKCRLKCSEKLKDDIRKCIFTEFWKLGNINMQRAFISKYVEFKKKKRERLRIINEDTPSRRNVSFFYYLPDQQGAKIKVCQTFFLNTLSISHQMVKTVSDKSYKKKIVFVEKDNRGNNGSINSRLPYSIKASVRNLINSIERVDSHYCRENSSKQYLPSSLNLTKMYDLYKEYCTENAILNIAKISIYRQIFLNEFNLGFHVPKKDQCSFCNKINNNSNIEEQAQLQTQYEEHLKSKQLSREKKLSDKVLAEKSKEYCVAVYDLQKVLICPKAEISQLYYKRKLATYNLTVYDIGRKQGYCYMWHEGIAARGACEVGSCVYDFIQSKVQDGFKKFSFYSDNCGGQNRNRFIFSMYMFCAAKFEIDITHNFLETGHTQNEGDSMHSVIEKASKNVPVFCPSQWYDIARMACKIRPYIVKEMDTSVFYNFKKLLEETTKNWKKDEIGNAMVWNKVKVVEVYSDNPYKLYYQYSYTEEKKCIDTLHKIRVQLISFKEYNLLRLRNSDIPISDLKYKDMVKLCKDKIIPEIYHTFYYNLKHVPNQNNANVDSD